MLLGPLLLIHLHLLIEALLGHGCVDLDEGVLAVDVVDVVEQLVDAIFGDSDFLHHLYLFHIGLSRLV